MTATLSVATCGFTIAYAPKFISVHAFEAWVDNAEVGASIVYAIAGNLHRDNPNNSALPRVVRMAYRDGRVMLFQRRKGYAQFEYIAVRRVQQKHVPLRMVGDIPTETEAERRQRLNVVRHLSANGASSPVCPSVDKGTLPRAA